MSTVVTDTTTSYPVRRTWTSDEFMRAANMGLFGPEERLELIEGEIIEKMPQHSPHSTAINVTLQTLWGVFAGTHFIRVQQPLDLGIRNQPELDFAVIAGAARDFTSGHPTTAALVIEVSDSTLAFDQSTKAALYSRADIQEYWIVNLVDRRLEVHRGPAAIAGQPLGHGYTNVVHHPPTDSISPLAAPSAVIAVADLLP